MLKKVLGTIFVNNKVIVTNLPIDRKFWDIYYSCCKSVGSLKDVELVRQSRQMFKGYHLYFDHIDMTATVVSYKVRAMSAQEIEETKRINSYEEVQQPA